MKITSQAQARFFGAVASGKAKGKPGLKPAKARKMLAENRGMKLKNMPERAPARRTAKRTSYRSGGR